MNLNYTLEQTITDFTHLLKMYKDSKNPVYKLLILELLKNKTNPRKLQLVYLLKLKSLQSLLARQQLQLQLLAKKITTFFDTTSFKSPL